MSVRNPAHLILLYTPRTLPIPFHTHVAIFLKTYAISH